jgi:hypothetical protein
MPTANEQNENLSKPLAWKFWAIHVLGLSISILLTAILSSNMDRGAFLPVPLSYIFQILLVAVIPVKGPALIGQFFFYRSAFWLRADRITRSVLSYIIDLLLSVACVILSMGIWVNLYFTDAMFTFFLAVFPYVLVAAPILAWYSPASVSSGKETNPEQENAASDKAALPRIPFKTLKNVNLAVIIISAFSTSVLIASLSELNLLNFVGLSIALLPLLLLVFWIYFLPASIAVNKAADRSLLILIINCVLGWTVIFWILCLIWAWFGRSNTGLQKLIYWKLFGMLILVGLGLVFLGVGLSILSEAIQGSNEAVESTGPGPAYLLFVLSALLLVAGGRGSLRSWPLATSPSDQD